MKYILSVVLLVNFITHSAQGLQVLEDEDYDYFCGEHSWISHPPVAYPYASEVAITDLVESRFHNETLIHSIIFNFPGDGQLYDFYGSLAIKGGQKIYTLFSPHRLAEEVRLLTAYEKLEIFIDTVFGLKTRKEGCPPSHDGNIANLLQTKFSFVLGHNRNGTGRRYGHTKTRDHFSDHPNCQGTFLGIDSGAGIDFNSHRRQRVSRFFSTYRVQTDYERLKVLLDIFTKIRVF